MDVRWRTPFETTFPERRADDVRRIVSERRRGVLAPNLTIRIDGDALTARTASSLPTWSFSPSFRGVIEDGPTGAVLRGTLFWWPNLLGRGVLWLAFACGLVAGGVVGLLGENDPSAARTIYLGALVVAGLGFVGVLVGSLRWSSAREELVTWLREELQLLVV